MRTLKINLDAIAKNFDVMKTRAHGAKVCAVVKANAYGHGILEVAQKLEAAGVDYFGVADISEGLVLRKAGIRKPILAWLHSASEDFVEAVKANIEIGIADVRQLEKVVAAGKVTGVVPKLHLKVDTGLGRNGSTELAWPELLNAVKVLGSDVEVVGIFSHLSSTNREEDLAQIARFESALEVAREIGIEPRLRHLTASDGSLSFPEAHYDMVRIGVALYGLDPFSTNRSAEYGLTPAMTATSEVVQVKRVPHGHGVSYNFLHRTNGESNLALIPVGYAEGLPRSASSKASVQINGKTYPIQSQVAMDQFVVDVGNDDVKVGDEVILFGDVSKGEPSVDDLAKACGTINYEIVTRMGGRFERKYFG